MKISRKYEFSNWRREMCEEIVSCLQPTKQNLERIWSNQIVVGKAVEVWEGLLDELSFIETRDWLCNSQSASKRQSNSLRRQ